eukprot:RCo019515
MPRKRRGARDPLDHPSEGEEEGEEVVDESGSEGSAQSEGDEDGRAGRKRKPSGKKGKGLKARTANDDEGSGADKGKPVAGIRSMEVRRFFYGLNPEKAHQLRSFRALHFNEEEGSEEEWEDSAGAAAGGKDASGEALGGEEAAPGGTPDAGSGTEPAAMAEDEIPSGEPLGDESKAPKDVVDKDDLPEEEELGLPEKGEEIDETEKEPEPKQFSNAPASVKWSYLKLDKPLMRVVDEMGYLKPTTVQAHVIRPILNGMDVCVRAVTGSGKTAAFALPMLQLLAPDSTRVFTTARALVLEPTRELAAQCQLMIQQLAQFSKGHTIVVITGGVPQDVQVRELKKPPTVVVATPGRLIDLLRNVEGVNLESLEILVLDEADRLLSMGFREDIKEILRFCPRKRQTLQFSATMTKDVDQLANLALTKPLNVDIGPIGTSSLLHQEFVRVCMGEEFVKPAMLATLLTTTYTRGVICFTATRQAAHHLHVLWTHLGLKSLELHGLQKQEERFKSLEAFRAEQAPVLFCTDIAARGLDIMGVRAVVNYDLPPNIKGYIHRVGRTARMGAKGVAVSFVADENDDDRHLLTQIVKLARINNAPLSGKAVLPTFGPNSTVKKRLLNKEEVQQWLTRVQGVNGAVRDTLRDEESAAEVARLELEVSRTANIVKYFDEISAKPQKTWHLTPQQKARTRRGEGVSSELPNRETRRAHLQGKKGKGKDDDDDDEESKGGGKRGRRAEKEEEPAVSGRRAGRAAPYSRTDADNNPLKPEPFSRRMRLEEAKAKRKEENERIRARGGRVLEKMTSSERRVKHRRERQLAIEAR